MASRNLLVEPLAARPRSPDQLAALFAGGWPAFIDADQEAAAALPRVRELFAGWEFAALDPATDELVAAGWAVPLGWDGDIGSLPTGYSDSLTRAVRDYDRGTAVDTAVICALQVRPDRAGAGVATALLQALIDAALASGLVRVIAPLRPTAKHEVPLMPIHHYAALARPDGSARDPWLRTHLAMGGHMVSTAPASQIFTAGVGSWRRWSGLAMPTSGSYLVRDALAPVVVDVELDVGTLTEPCIWVRHR